MKKRHYLLTLFIISQAYCFSQQTQVLNNFTLNNKEIIWQKVFEKDSLNITLITNNVLSKFPVQFLNTTNSNITFQIKDDLVDFKKYGGSWGTTLIFIQLPLSYFVSIDVKTDRYRVTIHNITAKVPNDLISTYLVDIATKNKASEFSTNKVVLKGLSYLDQYLVDKFTISLEASSVW